jgi:hypothetical protein
MRITAGQQKIELLLDRQRPREGQIYGIPCVMREPEVLCEGKVDPSRHRDAERLAQKI